MLWMTVHFEKIVAWKEKAVLIESKGIKVWLPKTKCNFYKGANDFKVEIPDWLFLNTKLCEWDKANGKYKHDVRLP